MQNQAAVADRAYEGVGGWLLLAAGFVVLYAPTYHELMTVVWASDATAYGYIILAVCLWLFWAERGVFRSERELFRSEQGAGTSGSFVRSPVAGCIWLAIGLLLHLFGNTQQILTAQVISQIPLVVGTLLCLAGAGAVRRLWFPIAYLLFLVPVPQIIIDMVTAPLKQLVSYSTAQILYLFDYPIARSGVVLQVGGYRLLVADACSGLNSLFSLYALGVVYLYKTRRDVLQNLLLLVSILPIACLANIVRVMLLVLITYHFGHDAGQGFLHGSASVVLLVSALLLFLALDELLLRFSRFLDARDRQ